MDQWTIAIATFVLAIVALFQDRIRVWLKTPRLVVKTGSVAPFAKRLQFIDQDDPGKVADGYAIRLSVTNKTKFGRLPTRAVDVEVFLLRLLEKKTDGSYQPVPEFEPMNLLWSHTMVCPFTHISPEMVRYCFVGRLLKPAERHRFPPFDDDRIPMPQTCLALDVQTKRHTKEHILARGTYRLECLIGSANTEAQTKTFEVYLSGDWNDDEAIMFEKGFGIKLVENTPG